MGCNAGEGEVHRKEKADVIQDRKHSGWGPTVRLLLDSAWHKCSLTSYVPLSVCSEEMQDKKFTREHDSVELIVKAKHLTSPDPSLFMYL